MFDHHLKGNSKMGKRKRRKPKDQQNKIMSKTGKQNMKKDQNKEDQQNKIISKIKTLPTLRSPQRQRSANQNNIQDQQNKTQKND